MQSAQAMTPTAYLATTGQQQQGWNGQVEIDVPEDEPSSEKTAFLEAHNAFVQTQQTNNNISGSSSSNSFPSGNQFSPKWLRGFTIMDMSPDATYLVLRLCLVWALCITAWGMLQAAVPLLLKEILGPAAAATWQGILVATTAVSGLVFGSALGYFSDKIGRMSILTLWCFAFICGIFGIIYTDRTRDLTGVLFARVCISLTVPLTMLFAFTSDFAQGKTLLQVHGYVGASFGVALMVGSGLSAVLGKIYGRHIVFLLAVGSAMAGALMAWTTKTSLVNSVLARGTIPYIHPKKADNSATASVSPVMSPVVNERSSDEVTTRFRNGAKKGSSSVQSVPQPSLTSASVASPPTKAQPASYTSAVRTICKDPLLLMNVLAFSVVRTANVNSFFMFVLYTNWRLQWGIMDTSIALGFVGGLAVLWQAFGVKFVVEKVDQHHVVSILLFLLVLYPVLMVGYGLVQTTAGMYLAAILGSITSVSPAIFTAKITTLATQDGIAGSALGVVGSVTCLMELPCSFLFSQLLSLTFVHFDTQNVWAGLPYFANAGVYSIALILVLAGDRCYDKGHRRPGWRKELPGVGGSERGAAGNAEEGENPV